MAARVSNRSRCHVTEGRSKVNKTENTNSYQSLTPEGEDSGVQLDEGNLFDCGIYEPEVPSIPLSRFDESKTEFPEVVSERENDAMTVHSSDLWRQTPRVAASGCNKHQGSCDRKPPCSDSNQKSRASDADRKTDNPGSDRKSSTTSVADRKSRNGSDASRDSECDRKSKGGLELLAVPSSSRRAHGSTGGVEFFTGSEPETDGDSEGVSFLSAPETMPPKKPCRDTRNKMRFKKFFRPLRRSKSTGNTKDSSSFSFLNKQDAESDDRQSVDTGRGSMEPVSDREIDEVAKGKETANKELRKKKSITSEVREKLYLLRKRYTDIGISQKEGKSDKPTPESIKNWSKSIEYLLADKFGVRCFHAFLKSEFSEENIDFWMACESYKALKASKQPAQAHKIFSEYITHQAPREINIDSVTREATCERMSQPDSTTFDAAQKRIQALMDKDSYLRFIQSTLYQELVSGQSPLLS